MSTQIRLEEQDEWVYEEEQGRYRNKGNGQYLSHAAIIALRDTFLGGRNAIIAAVIGDVLTGDLADLTPAGRERIVMDLDRRLWREVESSMIAEYVLGRGGLRAMTDDDYRLLDELVREQRAYWERFMEDIRTGKVVTQAGITQRANLYNHAGRSFHARAMARAWGINLPTMPGEQRCLTNCRCSWDVRRTKEGIEATWKLGGSENTCDDCNRNARAYNPLFFPND